MKQQQYELAVALRHRLHAHPELSGQESWTKGHLMAFLNRHTKLELVDRGAWFYGVYRASEPRGSIAFRADFDALPMEEQTDLPYRSQTPGVAHKCGHDGHSATLAALALEVDDLGADKNVYFIFQHAEEIGGGGAACAQLLEEEGIDEVYAFHSMSGYPRGAVCLRDGTMNCASRGMIIQLEGAPAHASTPELGRNPALAVAHLVDAIPTLTRPEEHRGVVLCTVIQIAVGEPAFGMSAHKGRLLLTLRAQYEAELEALQRALEERVAQEAARHDLWCTLEYQDVFPETANHPAGVERVRCAAAGLGLPVVEMGEPMRASEDFGYYLKKAPGAIFLLGNGEAYPPIHSVDFDFPDEHISTACALFRALMDH